MTSHPDGWTATELAQAAASRQLELYYQPLVDRKRMGNYIPLPTSSANFFKNSVGAVGL